MGGFTARTVDVELMPCPHPTVTVLGDNRSVKDHSEDTSIKCPSIAKEEGSLGHTVHNIGFHSKPGAIVCEPCFVIFCAYQFDPA
ncbi:hypothetical protein OPQ81_007378 [Rhizoctonia solani]|nr:hypothetical protein OPQ81_007378 [Rhizoctonia solani]